MGRIDRFEFDGRVSLRRRDLRTVPLSAFPFLRDVFGIAQAQPCGLPRARIDSQERRKQARKKSTTLDAEQAPWRNAASNCIPHRTRTHTHRVK